MNAIVEQIRAKVRMVVADERSFGVLSTGEQIAVALVLDRKDLLDACGWGTMLAAIDRLGVAWTEAAFCVQRVWKNIDASREEGSKAHDAELPALLRKQCDPSGGRDLLEE